MAKCFPGFSQQMFTFFRGLEKNNSREWFTPRKEIFEEHVRQPMIELATQVNDALRGFAVDHVVADPARALYRIYRDTRFSKDKTPYKTHIGITFPRAGLPKHSGAGYYFSVSHKEIEIAGGVYMPGAEELNAIRTAIATDPADFLKVVNSAGIRKSMGALLGEQLKRLPKDWQDHGDSPAAEYLRFKQLYWYITLPGKLALAPKIATTVVEHFRCLRPAMEWFNQAILAARKQEEAEARPVRPAPMW
ncbi:MAG: DUF2461 domain-containing protein [Tepidisphaerales bacterium]